MNDTKFLMFGLYCIGYLFLLKSAFKIQSESKSIGKNLRSSMVGKMNLVNI